MWKIAVCDDEQSMCILLKHYLDDFHKESGEDFDITEYHSAEDLLADNDLQPHIIFLDISMGNMNGMEAAKKIREFDTKVMIIFITTMVNYALEGYTVHAFSFLRKPVKYALFRAQMIDAMRALKSRSPESISLNINGQMQRIDLQELLYCEIYGHQINIILADRQISYYGTLNEIEDIVKDKYFFRCHRSYLVNLAQISMIGTDSVTLRGGHVIPVSKYKRKDLMIEFADFAQRMN